MAPHHSSLELTPTAPQRRPADTAAGNAALGRDAAPSGSDTGAWALITRSAAPWGVVHRVACREVHFQEHVISGTCLRAGGEPVRRTDDLKFPEPLGTVVFA